MTFYRRGRIYFKPSLLIVLGLIHVRDDVLSLVHKLYFQEDRQEIIASHSLQQNYCKL